MWAREWRMWRDSLGWTQKRLADAIGVRWGYLSMCESGRRLPMSHVLITSACAAMGHAERAEYWCLLADWERMLKRLPAQALLGGDALEAIGQAFARGEMTRAKWLAIGEAIQ